MLSRQIQTRDGDGWVDACIDRLQGDIDELVAWMNVHCQCMNGPAGEVAGYLAYGSSMDYVYSDARVSYPLTVEVYGPNGLGTFAAGSCLAFPKPSP